MDQNLVVRSLETSCVVNSIYALSETLYVILNVFYALISFLLNYTYS